MIFFISTKFLGSASFAMNFSVVVQEDNMVGQVYFMVGARTKLWKTDNMETHKSSRYLHNFTSRQARQCPTLDLDLPRIPQYVPPKKSYHNATLPWIYLGNEEWCEVANPTLASVRLKTNITPTSCLLRPESRFEFELFKFVQRLGTPPTSSSSTILTNTAVELSSSPPAEWNYYLLISLTITFGHSEPSFRIYYEFWLLHGRVPPKTNT